MNMKFKKTTAIILSALIMGSVATLTSCAGSTDSENKGTATEATTEAITEATTGATRIVKANNEDGIYVEGELAEDTQLSANFMEEALEVNTTSPLYKSQLFYKEWFTLNNNSAKFYEEYFSVRVYSDTCDYISNPPKLKVFVPYEKENLHVVHFDADYHSMEIPSEYINGEYVFSLDPANFPNNQYYAFFLCSSGVSADNNAQPTQQTLTDKETGITVSGEILPDTQLMVYDYSNNHTLASEEVTTPGLYYIALIRNKEEITPSSSLTITIPGENGNKVGYYRADKFNDRVLSAISGYSFESADVGPENTPVIDENDPTEELVYLENSYDNNSYTFSTDKLGMFGVGTEDKLDPEYLCRVDFSAPC